MVDIAQLKSRFPLESKELTLRLFAVEDITESYVSWLNNPLVVRYSNQRFRSHSQRSCLEYFNNLQEACALFIAVIHNDSQEMIGTMTAYINPHHATADLGILLGNTQYWGQGYGQLSWQLLLDTVSSHPQIRKVTAGTLSCNKSMLGLMIKSGMVLDGVRHQQEIVEGQAFDIIHYARFNPEFIQD